MTYYATVRYVIENVPSADELRSISLRLYFKAWADTVGIITEWEEYGSFLLDEAEDEDDDHSREWHAYIEAAQSDLQAIYTLIQQSQEIGLKATICEVSPFLLLKRSDVRPIDPVSGVWDFTDFPTIDPSELVRVHNIFCSTTLSKEFQTQYEEIRRNRNKISHLGIYRERIDPDVIIDILRRHYDELYQGRRWMEDRLHFATLHRWVGYGDEDFNERTALFNELWLLLPRLSDEQFKWMMGHDRAEPRYICHHCAYDANLGTAQPYANDVPTAYRVEDKLAVECVICNKRYAIKPAKCPRDSCHCEFQSAEDRFEGQCMECGWTEEDWMQDQIRKEEQQRQLNNFKSSKPSNGDDAV
jgi:hypothetical protein